MNQESSPCLVSVFLVIRWKRWWWRSFLRRTNQGGGSPRNAQSSRRCHNERTHSRWQTWLVSGGICRAVSEYKMYGIETVKPFPSLVVTFSRWNDHMVSAVNVVCESSSQEPDSDLHFSLWMLTSKTNVVCARSTSRSFSADWNLSTCCHLTFQLIEGKCIYILTLLYLDFQKFWVRGKSQMFHGSVAVVCVEGLLQSSYINIIKPVLVFVFDLGAGFNSKINPLVYPVSCY